MDGIEVGCDPELFLRNTESKFISSIKKFGGSKTRPAPIGENCYVQEDNVALEFNIPPAKTVEAFVSSIEYSLKELSVRAEKLQLSLAIVPAAHFDKDQLRDPKAKVFGCDPDFNAWTKTKNDPPHCSDASLRSAGGHIHVGCVRWLNDNPILKAHDVARAMDVFLGIPSLLLDTDRTRRQLYGKAGAFRPKPYGMEYRTLSNFWIRSEALRKWAYKQTHKAIEFLDAGNILKEEDGVEIQKCINESNTDMAYILMDKYGLETSFS